MIAKNIKRGMIMVYEGNPVIIEGLFVQTPSARGASTLYKFRARNLLTKQKVDFTCKGDDNMNEADFSKRNVKFSYADSEKMYFMDEENFEMYELMFDEVADEKPYITEALEGMQVMIYNDLPVGVSLPVSIELQITQCDPGVKGNSATSRNKPATLETGLVVMVPEYIEEGTVIRVDSRTGEYLGRA
ncbi:MAG: elongation factor P [Thermoguttaceae bacterium]|nr:elongation factor P [Planctomycetaceae bacterium]MBP3692892.1 elongation factor P [Thermoguttaceae bacterium]MBQ4144635.1 elongation factor P [Thermoguttaceae bacterium]